MRLSISAHEERIEELRTAVALISQGECTLDIRRGDGETSTLEINWEESRDITLLDCMRAILALHSVIAAIQNRVNYSLGHQAQ
jgi:hypothetical protein